MASEATRISKLQKKLAVLRSGVLVKESDVKSRIDRKKFWSEIMETAEKPADRLKASELLGRTEADFTDVTRHEGADGGPIQIKPMNMKGLLSAIGRQQAKS